MSKDFNNLNQYLKYLSQGNQVILKDINSFVMGIKNDNFWDYTNNINCNNNIVLDYTLWQRYNWYDSITFPVLCWCTNVTNVNLNNQNELIKYCDLVLIDQIVKNNDTIAFHNTKKQETYYSFARPVSNAEIDFYLFKGV